MFLDSDRGRKVPPVADTPYFIISKWILILVVSIYSLFGLL